MTTAVLDQTRAQLLGAAARLDPAPAQAEELLRLFYRDVMTEDLQAQRPVDLLGAARSHQETARRRAPGTAQVRVFNPSADAEGWSTGCTVVEIVTDDMPFLIDSVAAELSRQGRTVRLLVHPQLVVRRDADGVLQEVLDAEPAPAPAEPGAVVESWVHVQVGLVSDPAERSEVAAELARVLADVRLAVTDHDAMVAKADEIAADLATAPPPVVDRAAAERARALLRWLADGQFVFLGYREYRLTDPDPGPGAAAEAVLAPLPETGLGLLRPDPDRPARPTVLPGRAARKAREPRLLIITKANSRASVHRPLYLDYIGAKTFDGDGRVVGERRFLGLFTAAAYRSSVTEVPYVAEKVARVIEAAGFAPGSHLGRDLMGVLEDYPRDELFTATVEHLTEVATAVVHLRERPRTRLFLRTEVYGRFVSCLVYLPRERYSPAVQQRVMALLREAFGGVSVEQDALLSRSVLAQLHVVVRVAPGEQVPEVDVAALEQRLAEATRGWAEDLADAARERYGEATAARLLGRFAAALPEAYKEDFPPEVGAADLAHLDALAPGAVGLDLYRGPDARPGERRLKVYTTDPLTLSGILPLFHHLGVAVTDERPYELRAEAGSLAHVYDFGLRAPTEEAWAAPGSRERFQDAFAAVRSGLADSDGFNTLVLLAGLTWREVTVLRTLAAYLRQTGSVFSREYVEAALRENLGTTRLLVELFATRFDPGRYGGQASPERSAAEEELAEQVRAALDEVTNLDHDRIIRALLAVVRATQRTSYYRTADRAGGAAGTAEGDVAGTDTDGAGGPAGSADRDADGAGGASGAADGDAAGSGTDDAPATQPPAVALKIDPRDLPDLPQPRPRFEIFVCSPRVEGVHLRFGRVARGGLRWSDRREDFRTEVLGLVKAQTVKNAVIVPTGAKGGFVVKRAPDPAVDRDAWLAEGTAAYRTFVTALLDVTDNRVGGEVVGPDRVVRHDGDDPYLVVAADKGTAAFSDLANAVARERGFWLDDAFASGGSTGYDHKKMGITARGAWESVTRHFRELGHDTQSQDFTVVGVGDMSGDVFGNGMLLSEHIRLVGAFDHRHVFLDPDPDLAASYAERRRLFDLPRSSWADYDPALISPGGGVYPRTAKSVPLTPQVRARLGIADDVAALTPAELVRAILTAPVDLLWNGGIGTYVKATAESHAQVGDRANDAVRVDGAALRCRVVGEGGNLGLTQRGRIEAALAGVRLNTDAIDNSGGVDSSDYEVNIKIALGAALRSGRITRAERDELLAAMTPDVARKVLRQNYEQNVLLGNARAQGDQMVPAHRRLMTWLEDRGELDRALEFLPTDAELARRAADGHGLTSPEFAVLVAYAKLALKADLVRSGLPDDQWFAATLTEYFPPALRTRFAAELAEHPLRREIVVSSVAGSVVNRGGITFVYRAMEETGADAEQVTRAFVICREVFDLAGFVRAVEALDNVVPTAVQSRLFLDFRRLLDRAVRWFLRNRPALDVGAEIARFGPAVAGFPSMATVLRGDERDRLQAQAQEYADAGVPADLAEHTASLLDRYCLLDVTELATQTGRPTAEVADLYFATSEYFGFDRLLDRVQQLPREGRWDTLARGAMREDLYAVLRSLTAAVLSAADGGGPADRAAPAGDGAARLAAWAQAREGILAPVRQALAEMDRAGAGGLAPLSVALRDLRGLVRLDELATARPA
ncbi:NAD-glutamate dehydrogenase [Georgenia sp. TF02-10]|uniref:NAD-glutamate dehydrogenase n=1 Tax=Georgenia sp. TF02-10 TaxID=2917725 RepID=UPI001FA7B58C|nr:NAD-glutamate dehydrogenase [Georgenia sp. TF02-10]UNX54163.1 NAD-glutamate dehydrogenase [Georgenia sp. TF02-10]